MHTIALIGLSGSGKTTVGPLVAHKLGWRYLDLDAAIVEQAGRSIAEIFAAEGEPAFRTLETAALSAALDCAGIVLATGGGIVETAANCALLADAAFVVWLHAATHRLAERLAAATDRPLLANDVPATLARMAERRSALYAASADWVLATDHLTPEQLADEIVRAYTRRYPNVADDLVQVTTPGGCYTIDAGAGILSTLPGRLDELKLRGNIWLVSDATIMPLHADRVVAPLQATGRTVHAFTIPTGEEHKALTTVSTVYDWLLGAGVERDDVLVALGGGVVGDLAGFVAATVLRGIAVVQIPTTVLAMIDSAIGGKTGVDHPVGKNLIGAFHQPRLVLADTELLATLPPAERAAGWAEAIKHGVIGDAALFTDLDASAERVLALEEPITGDLIRRAGAYKARIVSGDEREQGQRILLNYGHTIGHAVEAESGYALRHGECVAIGMTVAGTLALRMGLWSADDLAAQQRTIARYGLPTHIPATIDLEQVLSRIGSDKKVRAKRVRWVLPTGIGAAGVRDDVPIELVLDVLQSLRQST